jgi:uncharacterized membrane protein
MKLGWSWEHKVLAVLVVAVAIAVPYLVIRAQRLENPKPIIMTSRAVIAYREQYVRGQVTLVDEDYFKFTMETVETRSAIARHDTVAFVER